MDIQYSIQGVKLNRKQFKDGLYDIATRRLFEWLEQEAKLRLKDISCPTHGEIPGVIISGQTEHELGYEVIGCCDRLVDEAVTALGDESNLSDYQV